MSQFLSALFSLLKKVMANPVGRFVVTRGIPLAAREFDKWRRTESRDQAKAKVAAIEKEDSAFLKKIYEERESEMSGVVREAFEEALRRRGEL